MATRKGWPTLRSVALVLMLLLPFWVQGMACPARADEPLLAREMPLDPAGEAYAVRGDSQGNVWVGDYLANQIWRINTQTLQYTIFRGPAAPLDMAVSTGGDIWWTDPDNARLGRLRPSPLGATTWSLGLPEDTLPRGLALDDAGNVWITDEVFSHFHRFDPVSNELCTWLLPQAMASAYLVVGAGHIWFGDYFHGRIIRFDPASNTTRWWSIAGEAAWPTGLAYATDGTLWWADEGLAALARLDPTTNTQITFALPDGAAPQMLALREGERRVWYAGLAGVLGVLDWTRAARTVQQLSSQTYPAPLTPACTNLGSGTNMSVTTETGTGSPADLPLAMTSADGWTVFTLPGGSDLWGITADAKGAWVADQGRAKLVSVPAPAVEALWTLYLPLLHRASQ